ncbi:unnamed protein product [Adineta steineri]|uniref:Ubiquitin thioesterase OTU n=1 Tax=Adineta steineri TaxID=433720 RepID=A0A813ZT19_9BILA|nr:unnamed protein product [Adineta steineri]CAF1440709.1 unnamed protein product [Adineta steineri]CAF3493759.1 unnamed protein product [Adineta steineri]
MAGPLLRIRVCIKPNKFHRMQIAARYRIIDLFKQIAHDLHLTVDQLIHISIYRNGPNGCSLLYPMDNNFNSAHYDVSVTLDKYGLSSNEELYIDLTELILCQEQDNDDISTNNNHTTSSLDNSDCFHSTASSLHNSNELLPPSSSLIPAKTTNNLSTNKSLIGQLIRFSVPADNSCLFSSIYFVLHSGKLDLASNKYLRNLVATKIESDHVTYSEAMLGRTNSEYSKWIRRDDSWGGGIELAILTQEYEIEICVINTECGGRIDYFGEDRHFPYRVFLLYNNLHYDPVYLVTYDVVQQKELIQTKFHRNDEAILTLAKDLVDQFNSSTSDDTHHSTSYKKNSSGTSSESHLMHVKI